ncbi:MAG: 16S rRNA (uracil(1498)-N(3))-methyltransferase [Clostridia bacterium]|nr:16S rRNA (uracil(1498)-N(3))-methyltransferase [Clostridia bacterium]
MAFVPRVYIGSDLIKDGTATVAGSDYNHIVNVLRKKEGDTVTVCDMHSKVYEAKIERIGDGEAILLLGEASGKDCEIGFPVTVYQCLPKGEKTDTVIQKSVELGASAIVLVESERCVARPDKKSFEKKLERYRRISESAAAQCGRSFVPEVRGLISFGEAIKEIAACGNGFICYEGDGTVPVREVIEGAEGGFAFLIGPEGGISMKEAETAKEAGLALVSLGKRILRTETAALYVLSAISVLKED